MPESAGSPEPASLPRAEGTPRTAPAPPAPSVSVVVPLHDDAASVALCLDAVAAQTRPAMEVLVVDDASTDGSERIAERHPSRPRLLRTGANGGPAVARNLGARHARGDILFFVDADVALAPEALAEAVGALTQGDPEPGSVCGTTAPEPLLPTTAVGDYRILQSYYWRKSSEGVVTPWFSALAAIRRPVFLELGGLNPRLRQTEEVDFGVRLTRTNRSVVLSARVLGRHNDEERLLALVRKLARRARLRVPLYVAHRGFMRGFETGTRALGSLAAAAGVVTLPLLAAAPWADAVPLWTCAVPLVLLAASVACDAGFHRYLLRGRGPLTGVGYAALHAVTGLAVTAGAACGAVQWVCSPRFRELYTYREPDTPATAPLAEGRA